MRLICVPAALILVSAITSGISSALVVPATISDLAKEARVIFAGTVTEASPEWNPRHTTIVTRVKFTRVVVIKGTVPSDNPTLTISEGRVGDEEIVTEGQPRFAAGDRCILLCNTSDLGSERNRYLPIVGISLGVFRVLISRSTGSRIVADAGGREIVGIENGQLVVVADTQPPRHEIVGAVTDLPLTAERGEPPDENDPRRKGAPPKRPSREAPDIPEIPRDQVTRSKGSDSLPPADWVPGSQRVVDYGVPTVRVLDSKDDPGTRISESEFLTELTKLARRGSR